MEALQSTAARSSKVEWWLSQIILELEGTATVSSVIAGNSGQKGKLIRLQTTLPVDEVKDIRNKFQLWAGNNGARNAPETSFSLESRLAAAGELLEQVTNLLTDIAEALDDLFQRRPSTKASTVDIAKLALLQADDPDIEDTESYVSVSSSLHRAANGDSTLDLPTLAQVRKGETVFECPFCFGLQTMIRDREWHEHAVQDLKAYVCTQGGAQCDSRLFGNSRAWFEHEVLFHRRKWTCVLCHKGPFDSWQQMEDHTRSAPADIVPQESQWKVVVEASQQSADAIPARDCPFCDAWAESLSVTTHVPEGIQKSGMVVTVDPTQFRRHVAAHQEQLAMCSVAGLCLPRHSLATEHSKVCDCLRGNTRTV
jgi:hypothetical protein